jgi:hypothetical protein
MRFLTLSSSEYSIAKDRANFILECAKKDSEACQGTRLEKLVIASIAQENLLKISQDYNGKDKNRINRTLNEVRQKITDELKITDLVKESLVKKVNTLNSSDRSTVSSGNSDEVAAGSVKTMADDTDTQNTTIAELQKTIVKKTNETPEEVRKRAGTSTHKLFDKLVKELVKEKVPTSNSHKATDHSILYHASCVLHSAKQNSELYLQDSLDEKKELSSYVQEDFFNKHPIKLSKYKDWISENMSKELDCILDISNEQTEISTIVEEKDSNLNSSELEESKVVVLKSQEPQLPYFLNSDFKKNFAMIGCGLVLFAYFRFVNSL